MDDDKTMPRAKVPSASPIFTIRTDAGAEHAVAGRTFLGRSPEPQPHGSGGSLITLPDSSSSVSKTHAVMDIVGGALRISDLGSTNGTTVRGINGDAPLPAGTWHSLGVGDRVMVGDRWFDITGPVGAAPSGATPIITSAPVAVPPTASVPPVSAPFPSAMIVTTPPPIAGVNSPAATPPAPIGAPAGNQAQVKRLWSAPPGTSGTFKCPSCKSRLSAGAMFCTECGQPVDPGAATGGSGRTGLLARLDRRVLIGTGAVAGVLVLAIAGWALFLRDGEPATGAAGQYRLGIDPPARYVADSEIVEFSSPFVIGDPSSIYIVSSSSTGADDTTLVARMDGEGNEVWQVDFDGTSGSINAAEGGVLLVSTYQSEDEEETLRRLDPGSGDELWSVELDGDEFWYVGNGRLYVESSTRLELLSLADGTTTARVRIGNSSSGRGTLARFGSVVSWDSEDEEVQVFSPTLEELTERVDVGEVSDVGFAGGVIAAAADDEVVGYDSDGERVWTVSPSVDQIIQISAFSDGWLVTGEDGVEAFRVADGAIESRWVADGALRDLLRGNGFEVAVVVDDDDYILYDARTGDQLDSQDSDGSLEGAADGYYYRHGSEVEAISLPGLERRWSADGDDDGYVIPLDGGYVIVEPDGDEAKLEVFG